MTITILTRSYATALRRGAVPWRRSSATRHHHQHQHLDCVATIPPPTATATATRTLKYRLYYKNEAQQQLQQRRYKSSSAASSSSSSPSISSNNNSSASSSSSSLSKKAAQTLVNANNATTTNTNNNNNNNNDKNHQMDKQRGTLRNNNDNDNTINNNNINNSDTNFTFVNDKKTENEKDDESFSFIRRSGSSSSNNTIQGHDTNDHAQYDTTLSTTTINTNSSTTTKSIPQPHYHLHEFAPRIIVIGVGGAGGNAINNMIASNVMTGVDFLAVNTDAQHLSTTLTDSRIQIGTNLTSGLGCGANPQSGQIAAEESSQQILEYIHGSHMAFVTAGMGGGTGTGASPVIAKLCYDLGVLTVGVVTKPFIFEGRHRMRLALSGLDELKKVVDTLLVIPNQNLFHVVQEHTSFVDSFAMADNVLLEGVRGITDLMTCPGLINLDFADVQAVMHGMGNAMLGTGQASGENRAVMAAEQALQNPLLGDLDISTARGMLVNISGGSDMTLWEVDKAAQRITSVVEDDSANIIFGSAFDAGLQGSIKVSVVATGIDDVEDGKNINSSSNSTSR